MQVLLSNKQKVTTLNHDSAAGVKQKAAGVKQKGCWGKTQGCWGEAEGCEVGLVQRENAQGIFLEFSFLALKTAQNPKKTDRVF